MCMFPTVILCHFIHAAISTSSLVHSCLVILSSNQSEFSAKWQHEALESRTEKEHECIVQMDVPMLCLGQDWQCPPGTGGVVHLLPSSRQPAWTPEVHQAINAQYINPRCFTPVFARCLVITCGALSWLPLLVCYVLLTAHLSHPPPEFPAVSQPHSACLVSLISA